MKIWQLHFMLDEYDNLKPIKKFTVEELQSFDGRKHLSDWITTKVERMEPEKQMELSDAPGFIIPVFSIRAINCLKSLISENVEFLPLEFSEKEYFGVNVITVLEAIDYEKSVYKTFSNGKRIMAFQRYAFLPNVIKDIPIFKISDEKRRWAFVSDEFKQIVEENNLTGFKFKLVWDSEENSNN